MAIELWDTRGLSDEVLEALRRRAVHACELGYSEVEVAEVLGVCRETVSRWWSAYRQGGGDGLPQERTGRPRGAGRTLTDAQARHLQQQIDGHVPEEVGIASALWTRRAVQELIQATYGIRMPLRTVGAYLRRWGYTPKRPSRRARGQVPREVRRWLTDTYPAIAARAAREGAVIHWGDETGVASNEPRGRGYARIGDTPVIDVTTDRFRVNLISAITNQGKVRFMTYTRTLTTAVFLAFLNRLLQEVPRKIFLIVDPHPVHDAAAVAAWLEQHRARIEMFSLPRRAPELNPDEYLNNDLKSHIHAERMPETRPELQSNLQRFMTKLQGLPERVKSYFQHPKAQYAATPMV